MREGRYPDATDGRFFFRPPGYSVFLAVFTAGHPDFIPAAKAATAAIGAVSPLLLAAISARVFRRRAVAIATGVVAALNPAFVVFSTEIQSEPLFLSLLLASGFFLLVAVDRPSSNLAVLAGAALGLAALTRSTALALAPLLLAPLADRRYPPRARAHLAASAVVGFALALLPWTVRNAVVYRQLIPVSDAGGLSFFHGNSEWATRYYELHSMDEFLRWQVDLARDMRRRLETIEAGRHLSPSERSAGFARMGREWVRANPGAAGRLLLRKAWQWLRPYPTPWFWPAWIVAGTTVLYLAYDAFAVVGALRAPRRGVLAFCVGVLVLSMAVHVVLLVLWRYRAPYWDPILILYGVLGAFATLGSRWKLSPQA